jgi:hypothetical protein
MKLKKQPRSTRAVDNPSIAVMAVPVRAECIRT